MKLTILIPTRNRAQDLDKLLSSLAEEHTKAQHREEINICCVNNFSIDSTEQIAKSYAEKYGFIKYHHQLEEKSTAEESMVAAAAFAEGDYIWVIGDDDAIKPGAFDVLYELVATDRYTFVLLNCYLNAGDFFTKMPYTALNSFGVHYDNGLALFKDFGLTTATTTMCCLCFKRSEFLQFSWSDLFSLSQIYSHSVGLLCVAANRPAFYLDFPIVIHQTTKAEDAFNGFKNFAAKQRRHVHYSWTDGLVRLALHARDSLNLDNSYFSIMQELPVDNAPPMSADQSYFLANILRQCLLKYRQDCRENKDFFTEEQLNMMFELYKNTAWVNLFEAFVKISISAQKSKYISDKIARNLNQKINFKIQELSLRSLEKISDRVEKKYFLTLLNNFASLAFLSGIIVDRKLNPLVGQADFRNLFGNDHLIAALLGLCWKMSLITITNGSETIGGIGWLDFFVKNVQPYNLLHQMFVALRHVWKYRLGCQSTSPYYKACSELQIYCNVRFLKKVKNVSFLRNFKQVSDFWGYNLYETGEGFYYAIPGENILIAYNLPYIASCSLNKLRCQIVLAYFLFRVLAKISVSVIPQRVLCYFTRLTKFGTRWANAKLYAWGRVGSRLKRQ